MTLEEASPAGEGEPVRAGEQGVDVEAVRRHDRDRDDEEDDEPRERQAEQPRRRQVGAHSAAPNGHRRPPASVSRPIGRLSRPPSGGLHLLPRLRVHRAPRDVAVEVCVRLGDGLRVRDLQRLQRSLEAGRAEVRVAVAVVVLEPRRRLGRAPRVDVRVRELRARCALEQHHHPDPRDRLLFRVHVDDLQALLLHLHPVVRPCVGDPEIAGAEGFPEIRLGRPDHPDVLLLRREELLGLLELRVGLVPRILDAEVKAGDDEHAEVVEPGDLALVAVVEEQPHERAFGVTLSVR